MRPPVLPAGAAFVLVAALASPAAAQVRPAYGVDGSMPVPVVVTPVTFAKLSPRDGCIWYGPHGACEKKKGAKTLFEWAICKDEEKKNGCDKEAGKNGNGGNGNGDKQPAAENGKEGEKKEENGNGKDKENGEKNGNGGEKGNGGGNGKNNGNGNGEEGEEENGRLQSDRPDFTEASSTVGRGRVQLEIGYTYVRDRQDGVTQQTHSYPEALLRVGMFDDWFELRLGQNFLSQRSSSRPVAGERGPIHIGPVFGGSEGPTADKADGAEDLYLGVKLGLTEQQKWLPEAAIILQATVPTGADAFSANTVLPGFNLLYGWDVIKDRLTLAGSFQVNRARDEFDHSFMEIGTSVTIGYTLTENLGAYTEWFAIFHSGSIDPDVKPQYYFNGGFQYFFTDNLAADIRAGVGLNRAANDFFAGSGLVIRY